MIDEEDGGFVSENGGFGRGRGGQVNEMFSVFTF